MRALQFKGNDNIKLLASTVSAWGRIEETPHRLSCAVGDFLQRPKLCSYCTSQEWSMRDLSAGIMQRCTLQQELSGWKLLQKGMQRWGDGPVAQGGSGLCVGGGTQLQHTCSHEDGALEV